MDLGSAAVEWFTYLPQYNNNRELPPDEQLRLDIRRMRSIDRLGMGAWSEEGVLDGWRQQYLQKHLQGDDAEIIQHLSGAMLTAMRQFVENTRNYENFIIDGQAQTDPVELFIHLAGVAVGEDNLLTEILAAVTRAAMLTGDDLKNYREQCDGSKPLESTALPAPAE